LSSADHIFFQRCHKVFTETVPVANRAQGHDGKDKNLNLVWVKPATFCLPAYNTNFYTLHPQLNYYIHYDSSIN